MTMRQRHHDSHAARQAGWRRRRSLSGFPVCTAFCDERLYSTIDLKQPTNPHHEATPSSLVFTLTMSRELCFFS